MLKHRFADDAAGLSHRPADGVADGVAAGVPEVAAAVAKARDALLALRHDDGHWCGELEGDSILQSEYLLLLAWLGRERTPDAAALARHLLSQQEPGGWWAQYPGGPIDVSATVKAVLALRCVWPASPSPPSGPPADLPARLDAARRATLAAGGAERVNSFTRYYLALLGQIAYRQCPAVPPELMLVPAWSPLNLSEMSAWSRTIVVPLSLLWAFRPVRDLPAEGVSVADLFADGPGNLPLRMPRFEAVEREVGAAKFDWHRFFYGLDRAYKAADAVRLRPLRRAAMGRAERWILDRLVGSDGLGAIFPPIVWTVVGLRCLGYAETSPEVAGQLHELDRLTLPGEDPAGRPTLRVQPCKSPVWDTAIATIALRESGLPPHHPAVREAADWLLAAEIRTPGDAGLRDPKLDPGGWCFEYRNRFYPDTDDTCMVLMALARCLPAGSGTDWTADFSLGDDDRTVLAGRDVDPRQALADVAAAAPLTDAIRRGVNWLVGMQNRDGGWGAFDRDNDRELYCRVPFADHNAMIDPSTADLTARMLELFGLLGVPRDRPFMQRAERFLDDAQEPDGSWYGRWGVNHLYGTWQALLGLSAIGVRREDARVRRAVRWLKGVQQPGGGFGESPATYDRPETKGTGAPTASQTAWALMGLVAAGDARTPPARRAAAWLRDTQTADGTWNELQFTGTGFPSVFYLRYHLYPHYFPLMALSRYERAVR